MAVNRFMTPAQMPQTFSPYVLPFEQMAKTLAVAESQYQAAQQGLYDVLDTDFAYIDVDANVEARAGILEDIQNKVQQTVDLSKDGDLRKIGNEIFNLQRSTKKRMTHQDGDIYKMASDYAGLQKWMEDNKEMSLKEPERYNDFIRRAKERLQAEGGSLQSRFSQENLLETPNWSDTIDSKYAKDIKANIINKAGQNVGKDGFTIHGYEEALKYVTPEEVMEIVAGYGMSDSDFQKFFGQEVRVGRMTPEQTRFLNYKEVKNKDGTSKFIPEINMDNPAAGAFIGSMRKYSFTEKTSNRTINPNAVLHQDQKEKEIAYAFGPLHNPMTGTFNEWMQPTTESLRNAPSTAEARTLLTGMNQNATYVASKQIVLKQYGTQLEKAYKQLPADRNGNKMSYDEFVDVAINASMHGPSGTGVSRMLGEVVKEINPFDTERHTVFSDITKKLGYDYPSTFMFNKWFAGTNASGINSGILDIISVKLSSAQTQAEIVQTTVQPEMYFLNDPTFKYVEEKIITSNGLGYTLIEPTGKRSGGAETSLATYLGNEKAELVSLRPASVINGIDINYATYKYTEGSNKGKTKTITVTGTSMNGEVSPLTRYVNNKLASSNNPQNQSQSILNNANIEVGNQIPNQSYSISTVKSSPKALVHNINIPNTTSVNSKGETVRGTTQVPYIYQVLESEGVEKVFLVPVLNGQPITQYAIDPNSPQQASLGVIMFREHVLNKK